MIDDPRIPPEDIGPATGSEVDTSAAVTGDGAAGAALIAAKRAEIASAKTIVQLGKATLELDALRAQYPGVS